MVRVGAYRRWKVEKFWPHTEASRITEKDPTGEGYWSYYSASHKTKEDAEDLVQKLEARTDWKLRVVEESETEIAAEEFDEQRDAAIETAARETKEDARSRCTVPPWAFDKCIELQEWAVDEMRLLIMNDEDLYEKGPFSYKYRETVQDTISWMEANVDTAFKPEAEKEVRELQEIRITERDPEKRKEQLASEIADRLWAPFVEQFTEIPREERKSAVQEANKAIRNALADYTTTLKANWPRRKK